MAERVLLIEDDRALGEQIVSHLRRAGFEPTWWQEGRTIAPDAAQGLALVVLDLMLGGVNGLDILKDLRSRSDVPVLVLSARTDTTDKVRALKLGADDYMTKPFWPEELIERVRARLRRPILQRNDMLTAGPLHIDLAQRSARVHERSIELTRVELDLLTALARRPASPSRAPGWPRTCSTPTATATTAPSTCTCLACVRSSAPRSSSRPCGASATASPPEPTREAAPRLALTTLAVTVPMVLALVAADTLARRSAAEALLAQYALERLQDPGAREACEAAPERFGGDLRQGPPPGERRRRPPPEGGGRARARPSYSPTTPPCTPATPRPPAISSSLAAALADADVAHGTLSWPVSEVVALVRMPWTDGPCAVVLAQGNTVPGFLGAVMPPTQVWLTPLLALFPAALIAFGPVLQRIRRLTAAVRASAEAGYTGSVALDGHDELTELSRAFDDASREVRLQLAATDRREQALRRFLANTTHDVMIPLTVLQGHLSALQQHLAAATPVEPETVSRAMEEAHYIASLLHNLAIMARIDADEPQLQRGPVDLDALLARVVGRHRPIARQLDVALGSAPPAEPLTADADVTLLEQAVSNLVYNAIRHNRAGGHVAALLERVGDRFRFRVLDDGPGISADVLARLTADDGPDDARTRSPDGHGLGLRITRRVAAIHHFDLSFGPGEQGGLQVDLTGPCATVRATP